MSDQYNLSGLYSLYELDHAYLEALNNLEIDENGEVIGGEHLALIKEARDQKLQNYAHMFLILKAHVEAAEKEKKRIEAIRKSWDSKMSWIKQTLSTMVMPGAKVGRISWRKSTALEISAEFIDEIPPEYVIQELKPVKGLIQAAIERGEIIPGCEIIERQNIQIK